MMKTSIFYLPASAGGTVNFYFCLWDSFPLTILIIGIVYEEHLYNILTNYKL